MPNIQPIIDHIVDEIYVLSMPTSAERRNYINQHLSEVGIHRFSYHDAISADAPEVAACYESGLVMGFPPCFRCGREECGQDDCNNVLIAPQVANFLSYLSLWRTIASRAQRALILEDDVLFAPTAQQTLSQLAAEIGSGQLDFQAEHPRLLRLGWAAGGDHSQPRSFTLSSEVRMANPCHAVTSAYAEALLQRFERIESTSDMFTHRQACRPGEAVTVFPPIASELSWSVGRFESLIHPKRVRSNYLRASGHEAAAEQNDRRIAAHIGHMFHRQFLIVGHPRCGTGFAASVFRQCGLDIGHERDGSAGLSSWMFVVDDEVPYASAAIARRRAALVWDWLVLVVRDLATAVPSVMRDNLHAPPSFNFRRKHILQKMGIDIAEAQSNFERALLSILYWTEIADALNPAVVFRVEQDVPKVVDFLRALEVKGVPDASLIDCSPVNADKLYQGLHRPKPPIDPDDWRRLRDTVKAKVRQYCERFGYPQPSGV